MAGLPQGEQARLWGGDLGRRWLSRESELDRLSQDVTDALVADARLRPGQAALEIGCGSGHLALTLARAVGPEGAVLGLDVSAPLLDRAAARRDAGGLGWLALALDDAETADLPAGRFDVAVSQFGVMFFADTVAAFLNIRRALKPGGRLTFACFAAMAANPWMAEPRAIARQACGLPPDDADASGPGPTALSDIDRTASLLRKAGFADVRAEVRPMRFHHPGGAASAAELATTLGPAAFVMRTTGADDAVRAEVRDRIRTAFARYEDSTGVHVPVTVNFLSGTNG